MARVQEGIATLSAVLDDSGGRIDRDGQAALRCELGYGFLQLGTMEKSRESLDKSIESYRIALDRFTPEFNANDWAGAKSNIGAALVEGSKEESGTSRLFAAAAHFRDALTVLTPEKFPFQWAETQSNLGLA